MTAAPKRGQARLGEVLEAPDSDRAGVARRLRAALRTEFGRLPADKLLTLSTAMHDLAIETHIRALGSGDIATPDGTRIDVEDRSVLEHFVQLTRELWADELANRRRRRGN